MQVLEKDRGGILAIQNVMPSVIIAERTFEFAGAPRGCVPTQP